MPASRTTTSLNGTWEFQLDPDGMLDASLLQPDRTIMVPMPWQAAFPELVQYSGYAWYRRALDLAAAQLTGEVYIDFGAVDYWCQVFVNGALVGEHEGGYTAFSVNATAAVREGVNTLAVRVYDSAQDGLIIERWPDQPRPQHGPPFDARDVPHGKQEWYLNVGGVWQNVVLRVVPNSSIAQIHVTPDLAAGTATVDITLAGDFSTLDGGELRVAVGTAATMNVALVRGKGQYQAVLALPTLRLWTLDDPFLYTAMCELQVGDAVDSASARFGMRSFGYRNGQFLLNDQPVFLLSALDQDFYPDTIYTVPSDEFLRDQFTKAKELGLNNLRCHIKPPDPRYLDLADEMGLLVWAEIPSWRTFWNTSTLHARNRDLPEEIHQRVEQLLEEMIARDFNHPSLVIWTLVNEDWGTSLPLNADDRAWVKRLYERCKQLDPTRLVVDNSACGATWGRNVHIKSDIDDFHVYTVIPDQAPLWSQTIAQFALRPLWTYSAAGDSERRGDEPLVLSEFGNWGLPSTAALRAYHNGEPAWFNLGPWWSGWAGEAGYPQGVEERFIQLGLNAIWPDYEALATASQWHQFEAMKFEIEELRRHSTIAGYVITEFTDCYWESNGLLDFARNPKAYHARFAEINAPDVIVPTVITRAFWGGGVATVAITISHYSGRLADGATLSWGLDGGDAHGSLAIPPVAVGAVHAAGRIRFSLPNVQTTSAVRLQFALHANASEIARNELTLTVYPQLQRSLATKPLAVVGDPYESAQLPLETIDPVAASDMSMSTVDSGLDGGVEQQNPHATSLLGAIRSAGYTTTSQLGSVENVAVSVVPDADLLDWVREGGRLLFLCEGPSPFYYVHGRSGAYAGNWMTGFSWLRPDVHPSLPVENPLGLAFAGMMPQHVILGLSLEDAAIHGDVLAGMFSGWVGLPAAHTVQFRYGQGRVVMTTFPLRKQAGTRPTATTMLRDLVEYLSSDRCQPTLRGM